MACDIGQLRGLRSCTPEQARLIRPRAEHDRSLLPRWQRGGDGIHQHAVPAAYRGLRPWRGRQHWLTVVVPRAIETRADVLAAHPVSRDMLGYYLRTLSLYAEERTGRRCIVRPDRLAELMECSERTVQRCQKAAEALGLYVIVEPGRMLTLDECVQARQRGSRQRGLSNEAALAVPAHLGVTAWAPGPDRCSVLGNVTPTRGVARQPVNVTSTYPLTRSAKTSEPPPAAQHRRGASQPEPAARRYDPRALDLAFELRHLVPWLREAAPGRLETALRRFVRCRIPWLARDVVDAIDTTNRRLGWNSPTSSAVRNPYALLASYLRGFDVDADHPRGYLGADLERTPPASAIQARNAHRREQQAAAGAAAPPPVEYRRELDRLRADNQDHRQPRI